MDTLLAVALTAQPSCSYYRQRKAVHLGGRGAESVRPGNENHETSRALNAAAAAEVKVGY
jgi:hypothetical protein